MKIVEPKVTLLACTRPLDGDNPERVVAAASKLCYSKSSPSTLLENLDDEKASSFLGRLSNYGHFSPMEHISFTFGIEGISRACSHQIVRHRLASYSQQSQRYVDVKDVTNYDDVDSLGIIVPPAILENEKALGEFVSSIKSSFDSYKNITKSLEEGYLDKISNPSLKQVNAIHKIAIEDARYVLPNECETKMVMTMNARSLLNFFDERCCNRAQWEIREVADQMLEIVSVIAPTIFENAGAPCVRGKCPEGHMSCGKPKVKKLGDKNGKR